MNELTQCRRQFLGLVSAGVLATGTGSSAAEGRTESGSRVQSNADWPTVGGDAGNTGHNGAASPPTDGVAVDWQSHFVNANSRPIVADGWISVWDADRNLYDIELETGAVDEHDDLSGNVFPVTVADGVVYMATYNFLLGGQVIAGEMEADDDTLWNRELDAELLSSPVVAGDVVCLRTRDGLLALDTDDGSDRWTADLPGGSDAPAATDGTIYAADAAIYDDRPGTVHAVDAASGGEQWTWTGDGLVTGSVTVAEGRVYVGTASDGYDATTVVALDAATGDELWRTDLESDIKRPFAVADGTVYVTTDGMRRGVYALDAATGAQRWSHPLNGLRTLTRPVVAADTVYVASGYEETVYAVDVADGSKRWEATLPIGESPTLAVAGDRVIVAGTTVTALKPGDETALAHRNDGLPIDWRYDRAGNYGAEPINVVDGTAVLGSRDTVYAFDPTDGETQWESSIDLEDDSRASLLEPLSVTDDRITVATEEGVVATLERADGDVRWRTPLGESLATGPTGGADGIYVGTDEDDVVALDRGGSERWRFERDERLSSIAGPTGDTVVIETVEGAETHLYGLVADSGDERWTLETSTTGGSNPIAVGGMVVVGDGTIVRALTADDGAEQWTVDTENEMRAATAADGVVYVATANGSRGETNGAVCAIEAASGEKRWSRRIGDAELPPVVIDGTVYVATRHGTTYALEGDTGDLLGWRHFDGDITALASHDETLFVTFDGSTAPVALDVSETITPPLNRSWPSWADLGSGSTEPSSSGSGSEGGNASETDGSDDGGSDGASSADDDSSPGFGVLGTAAGVAGAGLYRTLNSDSDGDA